MLENLEFDFNVFKDLKNYADEIGIGFLASAFDNESLEFLIDLKLDFIKIPSGEINNVPYLERISKEKVDDSPKHPLEKTPSLHERLS